MQALDTTLVAAPIIFTNASTVDSQGNLLVGGYFSGVIDYDPGTGVVADTSIANGGFYAKYDPQGNFLAATSFLGTSLTEVSYVAEDVNQNVLVCGLFAGTLDVDPGPAAVNLTSNGGTDVFVAKYNAAGALLWGKSIGGSGHDEASALTTDAAGSIFFTGHFRDQVDFDPGIGDSTLVATGSDEDVFVAAWDASGDFLWASSFGGPGADKGLDIAIGPTSDLRVCGYFESTVDFDPGAGTQVASSAGARDIFLSTFELSGNFQSSLQWGGPSFDLPKAVRLDTAGNIFLTGGFFDTVDFDPGAGVVNVAAASNTQSDAFVLKLDPVGNFEWVNSIGSQGWETTFSLVVTSDQNSIVVAGGYEQNPDFDPGLGTAFVPAHGSRDAFFVKYNQQGDLEWIDGFGAGGFDQGHTLAANSHDEFYATGRFSGAADFSGALAGNTLTAQVADDAFIFKFGDCFPTASTLTVTACDSYTSPSGLLYLASGMIADTVFNAGGCDSVITINLTIEPPPTASYSYSACDSLVILGTTYFTSGTYLDTVPSSVGCDTVVTLTVTINAASLITDSVLVCAGSAVTLPDGTVLSEVLADTVYATTFSAANGCDSIISTSITVLPVPASPTIVGELMPVEFSEQDYSLTMQTGITYNWTVTNGTVVAGQSTTMATVEWGQEGAGEVSVSLTSLAGCQTSDSLTITVVDSAHIGIAAPLNTALVHAYPVPFDSYLSLEIGNLPTVTTVHVYNPMGQLVQTHVVAVNQALRIQTNSFPAGIYLLQFPESTGILPIRVAKH